MPRSECAPPLADGRFSKEGAEYVSLEGLSKEDWVRLNRMRPERDPARAGVRNAALLVGLPADGGGDVLWECWGVRDSSGRLLVHSGARHLALMDRFGTLHGIRATVEISADHPDWSAARDQIRYVFPTAGIPVAVVGGRVGGVPFGWRCWQASTLGVEATWLDIDSASLPLNVVIQSQIGELGVFQDGAFLCDGDLVAILPRGFRAKVENSSWGLIHPGLAPVVERLPAREGVDSAFHSLRSGAVISYQFDVAPIADYYIYLGFLPPAQPTLERTLDINVNSVYMRQRFKPKSRGMEPTILEAPVHAPDGMIALTVTCDDQAYHDEGQFEGCNRAFLNAIWIFDKPITDTEALIAGKLNDDAVHYVQVGGERDQILHPRLHLQWNPEAAAAKLKDKRFRPWIVLPRQGDRATIPYLLQVSPEASHKTTTSVWTQVLSEAATFQSGIPQWDQAYLQAVSSLLMLRRYADEGPDRQGVWVQGGGPTVHQYWRFRSSALILRALALVGLEGLAAEGLAGAISTETSNAMMGVVQDADGRWKHEGRPDSSWSHHSQLLAAVGSYCALLQSPEDIRQWYPAIRRAADCIETARKSTQRLVFGQKPYHYGLMPKGPAPWWGDSRIDYWFVDNYWALYGLRKAIQAAECLDEWKDQQRWKEQAFELRESLEIAMTRGFEKVGKEEFLPAGLYYRHAEGACSLDALYPCEVLTFDDPKIVATIKWFEEHSSAGGLVVRGKGPELEAEPNRWVMTDTAQLAVCCMLAGQTERFQNHWRSLLQYASLGWNWPNWMWEDNHFGGEDIPDGEVASWILTASRLALVWENDDGLLLGRGWAPGSHFEGGEWPTQYGRLKLKVQDRNGRPDIEVALGRHGVAGSKGVRMLVQPLSETSGKASEPDCWVNHQALKAENGMVTIEF